LDELCANGEYTRLNIGFAFVAVGHVCAVGEINEVGARECFDQGSQHREATQAGIENADHGRKVLSRNGFKNPFLDGAGDTAKITINQA
jgi:hypothetical protein